MIFVFLRQAAKKKRLPRELDGAKSWRGALDLQRDGFELMVKLRCVSLFDEAVDVVELAEQLKRGLWEPLKLLFCQTPRR